MKTFASSGMAAIVLLAAWQPVRAFGQTKEEVHGLVQGVLARAEAIVSGRFEYRVTFGATGEEASEEHNTFTLSGPSWRVDYLNTHSHRVNHRDKYIVVHRTPQQDGTVRTSAAVHDAEALEKRTPHPPYFAGTLWYSTTVEYIRGHQEDARLAGEAVVDGTPTTILEWDVAKEDRYRAFDRISNPLDNGGILRLYVAPQLGCALPRSEDVSPAGAVVKRFDASGFEEVRAGLFYPKRCGHRLYSAAGEPDYYQEYEIVRAEDVNEPIPEEAFVLSLPGGAYVRDARTKPAASFWVGDLEDALPADLGEIAATEGRPARRTWRLSLRWGFGIGVPLLLLLLGLYAARRRARQHSQG
jgi:hypothetical protein